MRVVVVGATGNLGTSLLRLLARIPGLEVAGVARRLPPPGVGAELETVEWHCADLAADDLGPVVRGADAVVHVAWAIQPARDQDQLWRTNVAGSKRLFQAAQAAGVQTLVYSSSFGAYSAGPRDRTVDETWPTGGIRTSSYSRQKAEVEAYLDGFEAVWPELRVVRMRPALIFKRESAGGLRRLFAAPFLSGPILRAGLLPAVPVVTGLRFQCVHADDAADAFVRALLGEARGAFNLAAEPVVEPRAPAELLRAPALPLHPRVARLAASAAFHARLTGLAPEWLDLGLRVPLLATGRARTELGWQPVLGAREALAEFLVGLRMANRNLALGQTVTAVG